MQTCNAQPLNKVMLANISDNELMLRFQAGDVTCFEELVNRHKQRVLNLTYRFMKGSNDAEDIAQEVFIRIYKARENYRPSAQFTTWLHTICRNTCLNAIDKKNRRPLVLLDDLERNDSSSSIERIQDKHDSVPDRQVMHNELKSAVQAGVNALPEMQRTAFILARYEQCSYEEIAQAMNCSSKAIKSLLNRARKNLKARMKKYL